MVSVSLSLPSEVAAATAASSRRFSDDEVEVMTMGTTSGVGGAGSDGRDGTARGTGASAGRARAGIVREAGARAAAGCGFANADVVVIVVVVAVDVGGANVGGSASVGESLFAMTMPPGSSSVFLFPLESWCQGHKTFTCSTLG
jgi:hypothetical protein